jgi:hypothetical protein
MMSGLLAGFGPSLALLAVLAMAGLLRFSKT